MEDQVRAFEAKYGKRGETQLPCSSWDFALEAWQAATASHAAEVEAMRAALNECLMCLSGEYDTDSAHQHAIDAARAALKGDKP